jgi:hypothetical protein
MLGMQHNVVQPGDPRMRDPKQYRTETVYVNFATFLPQVGAKAQLLSSPQVRTQPQPGWQKVTLAEFLPVSQAVANGPAGKATAPKQLKIGDVCPACGAEVKVRPLLNGSFVGCLC